MTKANDILELLPFQGEKYDSIALTSLTAYSVYWLSQLGIPASLENLAVLNFRLFPTKFAMVGWPQFPDFNRTSRSVLQMRPKYKNLATSITKKGVFLNENGQKEAESLLTRLGAPLLSDGSQIVTENPIASTRGSGRPRTIHPEDQIQKLKGSKLYQMYKESRWLEAEAIDLVDFLEVYDHTPSKEKRRRLNEYREAAEQLNDPSVIDFLRQTEEKFHNYLHREPRGGR